jgi:hypothetical protein
VEGSVKKEMDRRGGGGGEAGDEEEEGPWDMYIYIYIYIGEGVEEPRRLSPWPSDGREAVVSENEKHG